MAKGVNQLVSRNPTMEHENDSRINALKLSSIAYHAYVLRSSCESTLYINQGNHVLWPDMDERKTTPQPYFATIKLPLPLNQAFQIVPFG